MRLFFTGILLTIVLSGCVGGPTVRPGATQLETPLLGWTLKGRLGIRTSDQAESASLFWRQDRNDYNIKLSGPLGAGSIAIDGNDHQVVLRQRNKAPISADNAEQLIYQQTGWRLPVSAMRYWIQGLASPDLAISESQRQPNTTNNAVQQPLALLRQQDWTVEFQRYSQVDNILLPSKIIISHPELRLTVIISQWQTSIATESQKTSP